MHFSILILRVLFARNYIYTVPDPQGHNMKLNTFKTSVALKSMTELDVVTRRENVDFGITCSYESTSQSENIISLNRLS